MSSLRYAFRTLARTPVVSLVVILSLALGIGANTAIFSLFHQALLKSLPVQAPEELVLLSAPAQFKGGRSSTNNAGGLDMAFSYPMLRELEKSPNGLAGIAAYRNFAANLSFEGATRSGEVNAVSGAYFKLLGLRPAMGRLLDEADDRGAGHAAAVLSYGFWRDRLGGRPDVLNKPMRVNAQIFTIVGVAPARFNGAAFGEEQDVFVPLAFKPALTPGWDGRDNWSDYYLYCFGRLAPGRTRHQAQDALNGVYAGLVEKQAALMANRPKDYLERFRQHRLKLEPGMQGHSSFRAELETPLQILMICTALVLLIAGANAANLLLARSVQRARDLTIRTALGASRWQIVRQLMTEALLLAGAGGAAGLLVGLWALDGLVTATQDADGTGRLFDTSLDPAMLLYALALALATGLLFGAYPAWSAARASTAGALKEDSGQASASRAGVRMRRGLVTAQVALSLLLLIPMGLFLKSLVNLLRTDLGMKTSNVMTFILSPELNGYSLEGARQFFTQAEENLAAAPGFQAVTTALVPLLAGASWGTDLHVEGFPKGENVDNNSRLNHIGPGFFSKMGIPLIAGREFTDADTLASPKVAVVNEAWVEHFAKGRNPLGLRFSATGPDNLDITVVGVVKNSKYNSVRSEPVRLFFQPYRQMEQTGRLAFYVHSALPEEQTAAQIRRIISEMDPDLPVEMLETFASRINSNIRGDRITLQLASAFALLATLLSMLGLYGVVAFGVARRTREIGIRMAMGAGSGAIRGMVFTEVALILLAGGALGVPGALALARLAQSQLYGVQANDPVVISGAVAALIAAAAIASWIPARRAAKINPVEALRYE
jgi:predicted permease